MPLAQSGCHRLLSRTALVFWLRNIEVSRASLPRANSRRLVGGEASLAGVRSFGGRQDPEPSNEHYSHLC